jgi:tetratricopeptide (TPR) repeat protein
MQSLLEEIDKELHKYDFGSDNSKILFARYNKHKAVFHDFRYGNYEKSLEALLEADVMLQGIEGALDTKFVVLAQLVQTYIYAGDLTNAYAYLIKLEDEVDIKKLKSNSGLYYLVKAKYQLEIGDYNSAKVYAQIAQETDHRELGYNSYTFPTFLISADIESRMGNINEAYRIAKKLHTDYEVLKYKEIQLEGRLNAALADVECNLNLIGEAEHHILKANELYKKELVEGVSSIEFNDDLAGSYTILGDIRKKQNRLNEALEYYKRAEDIYINRYKNKLNLDMVGILFYKISAVASMLKDKYISKLYYNRHAHYFGMDNERTRNIYTNYLK